MNKNIFCGIGWSELFDYPMLRKFIKEELIHDVKKILIAIPSSPHSFGKNEKDAEEFLNWLKDDFKDCKNVSVENFTINDVPEPSKYCGSKQKGDISFGYMYPIEYCFDRCDQDYFLRIETDFVTTGWNKIKKFIDETDFDLINNGCLASSPLDVSFWCLKMKAFEENVSEKIFLNGNFGTFTCFSPLIDSISRKMCPSELDNVVAYNVDRQKDLIHLNENRSYDHFQWMFFQIMRNSDKVYVLNPKAVDIRHYMGMNQSCTSFYREKIFTYGGEDRYYKYIRTCKVHNCYENYNMYEPCKKLMDEYYSAYETSDNYQKFLDHYNNFKY